ncbi:hypothetical protein LG302_06895 [Halomonas organivorans]
MRHLLRMAGAIDDNLTSSGQQAPSCFALHGRRGIDLLVQAPVELAFLVHRGEKLFNLSTGASHS